MKIKIFILIIFLGVVKDTLAQDPQFSQFYAAPIYYNPAFAGSSFRDRVVVNYRNQWPSLPGKFVTYAASYDHFFRKYNNGIAIMATTDKAGTGNLRSSSLAGIYAHQLELSSKWMARAGIQLGYGFRSMDYYGLTFGDQLNEAGIPLPTEDNTSNRHDNITYFDAGTGFLLYSENLWVGVSAHHLNRPNQSVIEERALLPMRFAVNAGYKIPILDNKRRGLNSLEPEKSVTPAILYKHQGEFDQLDAGLYVHYAPIVLGVWYRGLPVIKNYKRGIYNHDAVVVLVGYKMPNISFAYSYDLTVSKLGPKTGGAHELSLIYEFEPKVKIKRRYKPIPCPKF